MSLNKLWKQVLDNYHNTRFQSLRVFWSIFYCTPPTWQDMGKTGVRAAGSGHNLAVSLHFISRYFAFSGKLKEQVLSCCVIRVWISWDGFLPIANSFALTKLSWVSWDRNYKTSSTLWAWLNISFVRASQQKLQTVIITTTRVSPMHSTLQLRLGIVSLLKGAQSNPSRRTPHLRYVVIPFIYVSENTLARRWEEVGCLGDEAMNLDLFVHFYFWQQGRERSHNTTQSQSQSHTHTPPSFSFIEQDRKPEWR